jgi:hypothetical protein
MAVSFVAKPIFALIIALLVLLVATGHYTLRILRTIEIPDRIFDSAFIVVGSNIQIR